MDERMRLVHLDAADLAKTALMEVASVRSGLTQVRNGPSNDIYVLCIYDGSTARTGDVVEASLSSAAAVTHSDLRLHQRLFCSPPHPARGACE